MVASLDTFKSRRSMTADGEAHKQSSLAIQEFRVRIALTAVLTGASLFVILSKTYSPEAQYWAFGVIAAISWRWLGWERDRLPP